VDEQLWSQVEELALDPDPGVRWMGASSLNLARVAQPRHSWDLMLRMTSTETSGHVLEALLSSLVAFAPDHLDDVTSSIKQIYDRATCQTEKPDLLRSSANLLVEYWIWHGEPTGRGLVDTWIEDIARHAELARTTFFRLRKAVTYGEEGEPAAEIRARAIGVWADLVRAAWSTLAPLEAKLRSSEPLSADERSAFADLTQLLETAAMEVYFASGAYAERQASAADRLSALERRRFYEEGDGIFEILTQIGVSAIAHHLVETLSTYVDMDPRGVLLRLDAVLQSGRAWGYQLEGLAESEFVRLIEQYLATYRDLFLRDGESRAILLRSIDGFVEAGWPSARRLLYGLDDMFR